MKTKYTRYTKELLEPIVIESESIRQVIIKLGLKCTGGNSGHMKKLFDKFNIDTSHFKGQGWQKGISPKTKRTKEEFINEVLVLNGPKVGGSNLRKKLFEFELKSNICEECGQSSIWNGKDLVLQIHHKDGNPMNNTISNIVLLCPNCHTQTGNHSGKRFKKPKVKKNKKNKKNIVKYEHINRTRKEFIDSIDTTKFGWVKQVTDEWQVSHTTVRRWVKKYYPELKFYERK